MALSDRSGQAMISQYCLDLGISSPTSTERATALAELNEAYREMNRGVYRTERGERAHHLWSWLHPTSVTLSVSAQGKATYTHGDIIFTAVAAGQAGTDVNVTIASGATTAASESGNAISITYAAGATTAQVVAACAALTKAVVTGGSVLAATDLAETHLVLSIAATALASGFQGIVESVRFGYDGQDSHAYEDIDIISPEEMDKELRDWDGDAHDSNVNRKFCLRPKALSASLGTVYEAVVFPPFETAHTLYIRSRPTPAALTDSATAYAVGNEGTEQLIVAIARKNKELIKGQVNGPEYKRAMEMFADCVFEDQKLFPVESHQRSYAEYDTGMNI